MSPLAWRLDLEWSAIPRYAHPSASAAPAISASVLLPSDSVVWLWKAPRRSPNSTSLGSSPFSAASISPIPSRSSGGMNARPRAEKIAFSSRRMDPLPPGRLVLCRSLARGGDQAPLAKAQAPVLGSLAHLHVVVLRAREMVERKRELLRRDDPQVGLEAALEADARLGAAARGHLAHAGHPGEPLDDGLHLGGGDDEVQVPHRLETAAQASGRLGAADLRQRPEPGQDRGGGLAGIPPEVPLRVRHPVADAGQDVLLGLLAEPRKRRDPAVLARRLELLMDVTLKSRARAVIFFGPRPGS